MKTFRHLIYCLLYPIELILRFWFPYAFRDDPFNPEPQSKEERKKRRKEKAEERKKRKPANVERRENVQERDRMKNDINYRPKNKKTTKKSSSKEEAVVNQERLEKIRRLREDSLTKKKPKLGLSMVDLSYRLNNDSALELMQASEERTAYYWHDETAHQIAVKFKEQGMKDEYKIRDGAERRKLKPLIRPIQKEEYDRTHVIPIGYHGSESDKRLLIGFNSRINQVYLKRFEEQVAELNKTNAILWFVNIKREADESVKWYATVWNEAGDKLAEKTFHDKHRFVWKERRF